MTRQTILKRYNVTKKQLKSILLSFSSPLSSLPFFFLLSHSVRLAPLSPSGRLAGCCNAFPVGRKEEALMLRLISNTFHVWSFLSAAPFCVRRRVWVGSSGFCVCAACHAQIWHTLLTHFPHTMCWHRRKMDVMYKASAAQITLIIWVCYACWN